MQATETPGGKPPPAGGYWDVPVVGSKRERKPRSAYLDNAEDEESTRAIINQMMRQRTSSKPKRNAPKASATTRTDPAPSDEDALQALMGLASTDSHPIAKKPKHASVLWAERERDKLWTEEEDRRLREAIDANRTPADRPKWRVVASLMEGRSDAMCRNRWARIMAGLRDPGQNRCTKCGEIRKGHTCSNPNGRPMKLSSLVRPHGGSAAVYDSRREYGAEEEEEEEEEEEAEEETAAGGKALAPAEETAAGGKAMAPAGVVEVAGESGRRDGGARLTVEPPLLLAALAVQQQHGASWSPSLTSITSDSPSLTSISSTDSHAGLSTAVSTGASAISPTTVAPSVGSAEDRDELPEANELPDEEEEEEEEEAAAAGRLQVKCGLPVKQAEAAGATTDNRMPPEATAERLSTS